MLKVVPKLDDLTVESLPLDDWCATLNYHGLEAEAASLVTVMNVRPILPEGASTPKALRSPSHQTSDPILQVPDRTPLQLGYGESSAKASKEDEDKETPSNPTGPTVRWIQRSTVPSVDSTPSTLHQRQERLSSSSFTQATTKQRSSGSQGFRSLQSTPAESRHQDCRMAALSHPSRRLRSL